MSEPPASPVNDREIVRREYATETRFLARRLASWAELRGPRVEDATVAALARTTPVSVLDVGCGTGDFSARAQRDLGAPVVALDLSPRMAELAAHRGLGAAVGDIEALPFAGATFDGVLANRVLYHVPDLPLALAEIARVLRRDGTLVAVTYSARHLGELWDRVGASPIALGPFCAEDAADALGERFRRVGRRDVTGVARFPSRAALEGYLVAYGDFAGVGLDAALGDDLPVPFDATYRHAVLVAREPR